MSAAHVLVIAAGVGLAVWLAFCAVGWLINLVDRPRWWVAAALVLWLLWELAPGLHPTMIRLWMDLQRQAGEVVQRVKGVM